MKKLILLIVTILFLLSGCGGNSGDTGGDTGGSDPIVWPIGVSTTPDCLQDPFGHRLLGGDPDFHPGLDTCDDDPDDINGTATGENIGLAVHAVGAGKVARVRLWDPAWSVTPADCPSFCRQGNYVIVDHTGQDGFGTESVQSIYMHMAQDSVLVSEGDEVSAGDQIGLVSNTGNGINTVHLHFGFLRGIEEPGKIDFDNYVNPFAYMPYEPAAGSTRVEKALDTDTGIFDEGECPDAVNSLKITVTQDKPFYDLVEVSVLDEKTGEKRTLNIDKRIGVGVDGDQDDFEQGCTAVVPENHKESSEANVLHVFFGGDWASADQTVTVIHANGDEENY